MRAQSLANIEVGLYFYTFFGTGEYHINYDANDGQTVTSHT